MIAQHREMRLYAGGLSTWLATARYRKVKIPVEAIPMVRMRAPEEKDGWGGGVRSPVAPRPPSRRVARPRRAGPSWSSSRPHGDEQHRPREGRANLGHLAVSAEQAH